MKILTSDAPGADGIFRAASLLYRGGASAVWLFGSRASPRIPDSASDYDLAVEGLADLSRFEIPAARAIGVSSVSRETSAIQVLPVSLRQSPSSCSSVL